MFRLEHESEQTSTMVHTYIFPRLIHFITVFLWATAATFFRLRIKAAINLVCPQGKHSGLGGKRKRNIQTLGRVHGARFETDFKLENIERGGVDQLKSDI